MIKYNSKYIIKIWKFWCL